MRDIIAKKYIKALMEIASEDELLQIVEALREISFAFEDEKFCVIINSTEVTCKEREEFVASLVELKNEKLFNFLKLLNENDRLSAIPSIVKGLDYQIALNKNVFIGVAQSSFELSEAQLKSLEESFSKKFGATISLEAIKSDYPGIKVSLDNLGVEISFSAQRLKAQLTEHILKAI